MSLRRCCILILFFISGYLNGQPRFKIEHFSAEDGLSHGSINCIMKDSEGFMWFGSLAGINRFDGHSFISYTSSPGDMSKMKSDRIDQIVEDGSLHLWLKAYDDQIYRFDKRTEKMLALADILKKKIQFKKIYACNGGDIWLISAHDGVYYFPKADTSLKHYTVFSVSGPAGKNIPSNTIRFLYPDQDRNIWIGTPTGLALGKQQGLRDMHCVALPTSVSKNININSIAEDSGHIYLTSEAGDLVSYDKHSKGFQIQRIWAAGIKCMALSRKGGNLYIATNDGQILFVDAKNKTILWSAKDPYGTSLSIYEDRKGMLWMTPEKAGVTRFNPFTRLFELFMQKSDPSFSNSGRVRVFEDKSGVVWIAMKGGGFGYYDEKAGNVSYFYDEPGAPNRLFSNSVTDLYYDSSGILWLNTDDRGIERITFPPNDFNQQLLVDPGFFRSDNEVRGILADRQGRLWLGLKSGKLYVIKNGRFLSNLFINEPPEGLGLIYTLMQDSKGNIWIGTKASGLFKAVPVDVSGAKYKLTHFVTNKNDPNSINSDEIYSILEDKQQRIWVGAFDKGLNLVDGDGSSGRFIHSGPMFKDYPQNDFRKIRHMALDKMGNIWIGTTDGLLIMDAGTYRYNTYTKTQGNATSIGNNDVQYVFKDSRDTMWLATSGGGLDEAIGDQPFNQLKFKDYTAKDGLPNNYVLSCTQDRNNNLWIATQYGLSKFNLQSKQFRNYDSSDGLFNLNFSEASVARLTDNNIVFGSSKGYVLFNPDKIADRHISANLVFTNLQINNEDFKPGNGSLSENINYTSQLTLRHDQNTIGIDYAILDPISGSRQTYAYKLDGLDAGWRNNKNQRRATYTNLPPGTYTFWVKNLDTAFYNNQPIRSIKITILPPFWDTWWAYIIYAILAIVLIEVIRRTAITMLRLRHNIAVEKRLAALKMSFFTNVSHELRTPLTLIVNPIEQLEKILAHEKISGQGREYIAVVKKNAGRMVRFVNQLLDLRKIESGKMMLKVSEVDIVSFVKNIGGHFADIAQQKNISLVIESDTDEIKAWIDPEKMDIVIYNVLANAFKFTPADRIIKISIAKDHTKNNLNIAITDQGPGVEPEHLSDIFELYYEGAHNSVNNLKGTGIGLALAKELVELHHGQISASNSPAGGLVVHLAIKLGNSHFNESEIDVSEAPAYFAMEKAAEPADIKKSSDAVKGTDNAKRSHVLLVEDNSDLRSFLRSQLSELYQVTTAANGAEGLQMAIASQPDLILSDIMMPVMDGITMLGELKNNQATSHIPVILLTAKSSVENQIEGLKYGADQYITKPFNNELLLAAIDNLLASRRKQFEALVSDKKVIELAPGEILITPHDEVFLKRVIEIVEQRMVDHDFNIDAVAGQLNMSRSPFYKKFKALTNLAPVEFVRQMRVKRAAQFFDAGETSISDVAFKTGFGNSKYFATVFKEHFNMSPSEYIKTRPAKHR